jgi:hypothetical protein
MICPKCKSEFRPGFTLCSDCNIALVHELPAEMPIDESVPESSDFLIVCETFNNVDLAFFKSSFEAEGIAYYVLGDSPSRRYTTIPMQIFVRGIDVMRAMEIINSVATPVPSSEEIKENYKLPAIWLLVAIGSFGIVIAIALYKMHRGW